MPRIFLLPHCNFNQRGAALGFLFTPAKAAELLYEFLAGSELRLFLLSLLLLPKRSHGLLVLKCLEQLCVNLLQEPSKIPKLYGHLPLLFLRLAAPLIYQFQNTGTLQFLQFWLV